MFYTVYVPRDGAHEIPNKQVIDRQGRRKRRLLTEEPAVFDTEKDPNSFRNACRQANWRGGGFVVSNEPLQPSDITCPHCGGTRVVEGVSCWTVDSGGNYWPSTPEDNPPPLAVAGSPVES